MSEQKMTELGDSQKIETGRIKWYSIARQFGFVTRDDGTDIFVHHSAIIYVGNGNCDHARGICFRAAGLLPDDLLRTTEMKPARIERELRNQSVKFWTARGKNGLEARAVKRAP